MVSFHYKNHLAHFASTVNPPRFCSRSPTFRPFSVAMKGPIILTAHHKAGTVLLKKIFTYIAIRSGLTISFENEYKKKNNKDILFFEHTKVIRPPLTVYRGCHIIRDPRDMVISGYNYHLISDEKWLHEPQQKYSGMSYAQHLKSLDREEGIKCEAERFFSSAWQKMIQWDYENPNMFEVHYEDFINAPHQTLVELMHFLKFKENIISKACRFLESQSLERQSKSKHVLSGKPKTWEKYVSENNKILFKDMFSDGLIKMGYEINNDW